MYTRLTPGGWLLGKYALNAIAVAITAVIVTHYARASTEYLENRWSQWTQYQPPPVIVAARPLLAPGILVEPPISISLPRTPIVAQKVAPMYTEVTPEPPVVVYDYRDERAVDAEHIPDWRPMPRVEPESGLQIHHSSEKQMEPRPRPSARTPNPPSNSAAAAHGRK